MICLAKIMNPISSLLISGYITLILCPKLLKSHDCTSDNTTLGLHLTCVNKQFEEIPQDLDPDLQALSFNSCDFSNWQSNSFKKYVKLKRLLLIQTYSGSLHNYDFLLPLTNLEEVYFENASLINFIWAWKFPSSLRKLSAIKMNLILFNLDQYLPNFKYINLLGNKLSVFPKLNLSYPLETIILDDNPEILIEAEDLYPYCNLEYVAVNMLPNESNSNYQKWDQCHCLRLKRLLKSHKIPNNFENDICEWAEDDDECSYEYNNDLIELRNKCVPKKSRNSDEISTTERFPWLKLIIALVCTVIMMTSTLTPIYLFIYKNKQKKYAEGDDQFIRDKGARNA